MFPVFVYRLRTFMFFSRMEARGDKTHTCGTICLKYLLFLFNILFWVSTVSQKFKNKIKNSLPIRGSNDCWDKYQCIAFATWCSCCQCTLWHWHFCYSCNSWIWSQNAIIIADKCCSLDTIHLFCFCIFLLTRIERKMFVWPEIYVHHTMKTNLAVCLLRLPVNEWRVVLFALWSYLSKVITS